MTRVSMPICAWTVLNIVLPSDKAVKFHALNRLRLCGAAPSSKPRSARRNASRPRLLKAQGGGGVCARAHSRPLCQPRRCSRGAGQGPGKTTRALAAGQAPRLLGPGSDSDSARHADFGGLTAH
jgi:hypothetical protein